MTSLRIYSAATGAALLALSGAAWWLWSHRKTPEQRERERRERLTLVGRITDGTIVDFHEVQQLQRHFLEAHPSGEDGDIVHNLKGM